jgi:hypothetical protein
MVVFVFGNPDLLTDSLPLRILPKLKKLFPKIEFKVQDPNEEWEVPEEMILIDTVFGIDKVKVFDDMKDFALSPRYSLHDFDAAANLWYLQKLGKIKKIKIIGVPPTIDEKEAIKEVGAILRST